MDVSQTCALLYTIVFYKFYDFFCRWHFLINREYYNYLFQIRQHGNFRKLNRVIFTQGKHLESRFNAYWYCFEVIKRYIFHYSMKQFPIQKTKSSFEIFHCLIYGVIKVYTEFSDAIFQFYCDFNLKGIMWCLSCIQAQSSFRENMT